MSGDEEFLTNEEREEILVAREQDRAFELFAEGKDYRYIAADLKRSVSTAHKRVQDALHKARELRVSSYVDVELAIYQDLQDRLIQRLAAGAKPEQITPHLLAISKERRKLLGEDAPKRSTIDVTMPAAPSPELAAIVELAEKQAAADEEEVRRAR